MKNYYMQKKMKKNCCIQFRMCKIDQNLKAKHDKKKLLVEKIKIFLSQNRIEMKGSFKLNIIFRKLNPKWKKKLIKKILQCYAFIRKTR